MSLEAYTIGALWEELKERCGHAVLLMLDVPDEDLGEKSYRLYWHGREIEVRGLLEFGRVELDDHMREKLREGLPLDAEEAKEDENELDEGECGYN